MIFFLSLRILFWFWVFLMNGVFDFCFSLVFYCKRNALMGFLLSSLNLMMKSWNFYEFGIVVVVALFLVIII